MIIDAEVHLVGSGWVRGKYVMAAARAESAKFNLAHKKHVTPEEYLNTYMRPFVDPHCDKMVEDMDKSGIDMSVIWNVDWAYAHTGEPRVTNKEQNCHGELLQVPLPRGAIIEDSLHELKGRNRLCR